jgi:hypothetical protein
MTPLIKVINSPKKSRLSIEGLFSRKEKAIGTAAIETGTNSKKEVNESLKFELRKFLYTWRLFPC